MNRKFVDKKDEWCTHMPPSQGPTKWTQRECYYTKQWTFEWHTFSHNGISPLNPQKSLIVRARTDSKLGCGFRLEMKSWTALNLLGNFPLWNMGVLRVVRMNIHVQGLRPSPQTSPHVSMMKIRVIINEHPHYVEWGWHQCRTEPGSLN